MIPFLNIQAVSTRHADEIGAAIDSVVRSGWYLRGEATRQFEEAYATFIGIPHCIGCANGLDALTLILNGYKELGVMAQGDEVIVPANTFIASVLAITRCGLRPVFVEPQPDTQQLDVERVEAALTPRTRAVMVVHLYGRCAYTDRLADICQQHHLKLIEDNAQAHGCRYRCAGSPMDGRRTGALGDAAGHSFYPGKNLGALGDAGAVTTPDGQLADVIRRLGNYGMEPKYHCDVQGCNSRIDEIQAAVLCVKLRHLDDDNRRRGEIATAYRQGLADSCTLSTEAAEGSNVHHIFPIFTSQRDALQQHLAACGIETGIHYPIPPHRQHCYPAYHDLALPITDTLAATELSLPISPVLSDEDVAYIIQSVRTFHNLS